MKTVLRVFSIEVAAREKDDLNEEPIIIRLRKVRPISMPHNSILVQSLNPTDLTLRRLAVRVTTASNLLHHTRPSRATHTLPCTSLIPASATASSMFIPGLVELIDCVLRGLLGHHIRSFSLCDSFIFSSFGGSLVRRKSKSNSLCCIQILNSFMKFLYTV